MDNAEKQARAAVQAHLIGPLEAQGMKRRRGVTAEDHERWLEALRGRLAYMTPDNLAALAEVIATHGDGRRGDLWPVAVSIHRWARRLQVPPASESRLVRSYMASAAGRAALAGDWAVELYESLRKYGQPPGDYEAAQIRLRAEDRRRRVTLLRERRDRGAACSADLAALAEIEGRAAQVRALVLGAQVAA